MKDKFGNQLGLHDILVAEDSPNDTAEVTYIQEAYETRAHQLVPEALQIVHNGKTTWILGEEDLRIAQWVKLTGAP